MPRIIDKINERRRKRHNRLHLQQQHDELHPNSTININDTSNNKNNNNNKNTKLNLPEGWYYSFEFFPPKTEAGLDNLFTRIDRMSTRLDPLFVDVTWGESGSTSARSMAVASHAQHYCGVDVLLHLTCTGMSVDQLEAVLRQAKSHGIQNILALRGDPPREKSSRGKGGRHWEPGDVSGGECPRAIDLVKLIRKLHGDYFCIAVAGHPEGHPSSNSVEEEMEHLRDKIDMDGDGGGADFIITQFFYDAKVFIHYVKCVRAAGITCPILPGILPIQSYNSFKRMTEFCGISVPRHVMERLEPVKYDDEAVKKIGCEISKDIATEILTCCGKDDTGMDVDGIHFYTLNLERSVTRILLSMEAVATRTVISPGSNSESNAFSNGTEDIEGQQRQQQNESNKEDTDAIATSPSRRQFPWRPSAMERRVKEDVRPINWANRPKSYVMRTDDWDEFPNGRWGDSTSPAFGELSELSHFYSFTLGSLEDRLAMLGQNPKVPQDVYEVFAAYVEGKVPYLPWCETPLQPESFTIQKQLAALNRAGFLTVNSQPPVNGVSSSHPIYGWGGSGGYVYQKAYCECFVSPENAQKLVSMVTDNQSMNLYAVNNMGRELRVGLEEGGATALTWGVFPNREILQPTIFDPSTFLIWAEEAFSLWTNMWLNLYDYGTDSHDLVESIRDTYYLVAIIDNDFVSQSSVGKLWEAFLKVGKVDV